MEPQLIPINEPKTLLAAGVPWKTEDQARWAYRTRDENGLDIAFKKIGKRIYLDPLKFHEITGGHRSVHLSGTAAFESKIERQRPQPGSPFTKREQAAVAMMQGFISSGRYKFADSVTAAHWAVVFADALIAELEKTPR